MATYTLRDTMRERRSAPDRPAVVFDKVRLAFDEQVVLDQVSFTLLPGHTKIILGASGSGKSTILKLILGLLKPDGGQIFVNGQRTDTMTEMEMMKVRGDLGMVFQEGALFDSLTVAENVGYKLYEETDMPLEDVDTRVEEVLRFIGLIEHIDKMPSELSGGQRRRVAIARAMAFKPRILLYDEATTGLDPIEAGERLGRDRFDVDVEQIHHPDVLGPRGADLRAEYRGLLRAAEHVAQGEAAGHRIGVGVVVKQDQNAIGVAEEPLVLLHPQACQRTAEFEQQRRPEELRDREVIHLGEELAQLLFVLSRLVGADTHHVDERGAGILDRVENLLEAPLPAVLDDDAGRGGDVGFEVSVGPAGVGGRDVQPGVMQPARERLAFDEKIDLEAGRQAFVEHPDDQFGLTDGETPHSIG